MILNYMYDNIILTCKLDEIMTKMNHRVLKFKLKPIFVPRLKTIL